MILPFIFALVVLVVVAIAGLFDVVEKLARMFRRVFW